MEITVIQPKIQEKERLRVAAYCRVSKEGEEQENSIENQIEYYKKLIEDNPSYDFAGIYYDYGVSGYKEDRPGFQSMMSDARSGKIDLIITKSITRFARNTDTLLRATRELKGLGIGVFFELQNMNSLTQAGELLMTVHAAFAQGESETYRGLARMAKRRQFEEGRPAYQLHRTFGYRKGAEPDTFEIVPEEAAIIKQIFLWVREEYSTTTILKMAREKGFKKRNGNDFLMNDIYFIVKNEAYKGDYIMQKHFIGDDRKHKLNHGEMQAWYIEHDHPAIVKRKLWADANEVIKKRAKEKTRHLKLLPMTEENYPYIKKLFCGHCGQPLYYRKLQTGAQYTFFCKRKNRNAGDSCQGVSVPQKVIESWGDISENLYITFDPDKPIPKQYTRHKESTWKKQHKKINYFGDLPPYTKENYHYCRRLFCEKCGWPLYRTRRADGMIQFVCGGRNRFGKEFCGGVTLPLDTANRLPEQDGYYVIREEKMNGKKHHSYSCRPDKPVRKKYQETGKED